MGSPGLDIPINRYLFHFEASGSRPGPSPGKKIEGEDKIYLKILRLCQATSLIRESQIKIFPAAPSPDTAEPEEDVSQAWLKSQEQKNPCGQEKDWLQPNWAAPPQS
jgi:hypothetical protein